MEAFTEFLASIEQPNHRARATEVLAWVRKQFPSLKPKVAWNQPMFTEHGTFIVGFSAAKHHLAMAPEAEAMVRFSQQIEQAGYEATAQIIRLPWDRPVDYGLLSQIIAFNMVDKAGCQTFWRK